MAEHDDGVCDGCAVDDVSNWQDKLNEDERAILVQAEKPYGSVDERYLRDWLLDTLRSLAASRKLVEAKDEALVEAIGRVNSLISTSPQIIREWNRVLALKEEE